jgi:hypothetical protein
VPGSDAIELTILNACHNCVFAGHMGQHKTVDTVKRLFYWPCMDADIAQYVAACHVCQTAKSSQ